MREEADHRPKKKEISTSKRYTKQLRKRAKFFYIYPAIPSIFAFLFGLATSFVYATGNEDFKDCKDYKDEMIDDYIFGAIIIWFLLPIAYGNLLFQAIKYLDTLLFNFVFFLIYILFGFIWHILGVVWAATTECTETIYVSVCYANMAVFLLLDLIMFIVFIICFPCYKDQEGIGGGVVENVRGGTMKEESEERQPKPPVGGSTKRDTRGGEPNEEKKEDIKKEDPKPKAATKQNTRDNKEEEDVPDDNEKKKKSEEKKEEEEVPEEDANEEDMQ